MEKSKIKKKINYKENLKEYFGFVGKYKFLFWAMILSVTITEALFIADKFLYKWLIDDAGKFVEGTMSLNSFGGVLLLIAGIFAAIIALRSFGRYLNSFLLAKLDVRLIFDLKKKYFKHILSLSHKFHTEHKTGKLISRLGRGTSAIENLTDVIIFQIAPLILQIIMIIASFLIFAKSSAIILAIVAVSFIGFSIYINKVQTKHKIKFNKATDKESGFIADILTNVETVKYFGKEHIIDNKFDKIISDVKSKGFTFFNSYSHLAFGQNLILGFGLIAMLYFPLKEFMTGAIPLSTLVFIYAMYASVSGSLKMFVWGIKGFYRAMADMQDLFEYGKIENDIKDSPKAKTCHIKKGAIEFNGVSFEYDDKKVLSDFNLKIKPEETVALVGHSGSGKTTLVKLFNRLYDVNKGKITVDGEDIKNFKQQSLRSESSIVPQECILFDDTIYNNILFVNPSAKKKDVMKAISLAQLDNIIKGFPKGLDTIVGERGVKLSGGEKQRVSIARAILANKKVLILDEATSALDSRTEHEIQKAMKNLLKGRTSIVIAHRLSTIMNADRIIVLKNGKIIEEGKHNELVKKNGEYAALWDLQKGGYISE